MDSDFASVFAALKQILAKHEQRLSVKTDTLTDYTLQTRTPSPFPQHKGEPMFFASVRLGKAYVSFHLMPLYMCPPLLGLVTPNLKKRMQGKTCFNFKHFPDPELTADLDRLTEAALRQWQDKKWL